MTTLSDLLVVPTPADMLNFLVSMAQLAGFPTASWQSGSVPSTVFQGEAANLSDLAASMQLIAMGGFIGTAENPSATGAWLDLCAGFFSETRKPAGFCQQNVTLTAALGAGPFTVTPGQYWVSDATATYRYQTVLVNGLSTSGTLPMGGTLTITVQAEIAGAVYNLIPGAINAQVTPLVGVSVINPAGVTGTAITQQGVDVETDAAFATRCVNKWGTLGSGSNDAAYVYWATSSSPEVTRTTLSEDWTIGMVNLVIAGPSGPVSSAAFALVQATVAAKRPLGVKVVVTNALPMAVPVVATVYRTPGAVGSVVTANVGAALNAYVRTTNIGGMVYQSDIIAAIQSAAGVQNVDVGTMTPATDFQLAANAVWTPSYSLAIV